MNKGNCNGCVHVRGARARDCMCVHLTFIVNNIRETRSHDICHCGDFTICHCGDFTILDFKWVFGCLVVWILWHINHGRLCKIHFNTNNQFYFKQFSLAWVCSLNIKNSSILKNVASNIEEVLAATSHKAPTIRPPASHHENYPS